MVFGTARSLRRLITPYRTAGPHQNGHNGDWNPSGRGVHVARACGGCRESEEFHGRVAANCIS